MQIWQGFGVLGDSAAFGGLGFIGRGLSQSVLNPGISKGPLLEPTLGVSGFQSHQNCQLDSKKEVRILGYVRILP